MLQVVSVGVVVLFLILSIRHNVHRYRIMHPAPIVVPDVPKQEEPKQSNRDFVTRSALVASRDDGTMTRVLAYVVMNTGGKAEIPEEYLTWGSREMTLDVYHDIARGLWVIRAMRT